MEVANLPRSLTPPLQNGTSSLLVVVGTDYMAERYLLRKPRLHTRVGEGYRHRAITMGSRASDWAMITQNQQYSVSSGRASVSSVLLMRNSCTGMEILVGMNLNPR